MVQVLNAYLYQHRSLSIPGLGTIYLETFSASVEVADRTMLSPIYRFRFDKYFDAPDKEFFSFLATQSNLLDFEAIKWYNEFALDLRNRIRAEVEVRWEGVGVLRKNGSGDILLESVDAPAFSQQPVPAMRVNRQDAQHTLLVGDRERTSGEMTEWRKEEGSRQRKFHWWIIAVILGALGLAFLGWYFYTHGFSTGNQTKL